MRILSSFLVLFTLLSFAQSESELPPFTVSGLLPYQGMSISVYLVSSANSFVGDKKKINRVFDVLDNRVIVESDIEVVPKSEARSSFGVKPNAVVVVVHSSTQHALNRLSLSPLNDVGFKEPKYSHPGDRVEPTQENKKFLKKVIVPLDQLLKDGIIKI